MLSYSSDEQDLDTKNFDIHELIAESTVKSRRVGVEYTFVKSFPNEASVTIESYWKKVVSHDTEQGFKQFYYCNLDKNHCPKRCFLLYVNSSDQVHFFENSCEHEHTSSHRGLSGEQKAIVKRLYDQGLSKPSLIVKAFEAEAIETPAPSKIITFLRSYKTSLNECNHISLGQLKTWCEEHNAQPNDIDESFILNFYINQNEDEPVFRFFVTTLRLIGFLKLSYVVTIDTTHKLIWQGYPVLIIGVIDNNKSFHPIGLMVSNNEQNEDFEFVFSSIKSYEPDFKANFLVSDCADPVTDGFEV